VNILDCNQNIKLTKHSFWLPFEIPEEAEVFISNDHQRTPRCHSATFPETGVESELTVIAPG